MSFYAKGAWLWSGANAGSGRRRRRCGAAPERWMWSGAGTAEREMQSYIEEREREVAEREAAWKAELSRREFRFCHWSIS